MATLLKDPIQIGKLTLNSRIIFSPLAGCSDYSFRKMVLPYRPSLFFCEMVKMEPLVRGDSTTFRLLDYDSAMHPIGAQLCGSRPQLAAPAAKIIEELGFDIVDLNCGCPVDKVTKDGSGSALLRNLDIIGEIIANMVTAVSIPVSLKIRAGWDDDDIIVETVTKIAEKAGASLITIHGRTREQGYSGESNWNYIRRAKEASRFIPVFGNGDLFSPEKAVESYQKSGVDGIVISRGTLGSPWIADDILRHAEGLPPLERGVKQALLNHLQTIADYEPEGRAPLIMRKVGCWYLKEAKGAKELRSKMSRVGTAEEAINLVEEWFSNHIPLTGI